MTSTLPSPARRRLPGALRARAAGRSALALAAGLALGACGRAASTATTGGSGGAPAASTPASGSGAAGGGGTGTSSAGASTASCLVSSGAPAPGGPALADVQFVGARRGWAVGTGAILATTDGGAHWQHQLTGDLRLGGLDFVSATTGWAVGSGQLLGTTDGGRCWQRLGEPAAGSLRSVHFVSPVQGWGVAAGSTGTFPAQGNVPVAPQTGGVLVRTSDGGRHWVEVPGAPVAAQSVCFVDGHLGWLGAAGRVYRSTDAGAHWSEVLDAMAGSVASGTVTPVETVGCGAPADVWAVSATGQGAAGTSPWAVFASTDGQHFRMVAQAMYGVPATGQAPAPGSYPGVVSVIGGGLAAVAGSTPALPPPMAGVEVLSATGRALTGVGRPTAMAAPTGLAFVSPSTGWVVGSVVPSGSSGPAGTEGEIAATTDGGATWTVQATVP